MALELRQQLKLSQQLIMTPQLQMAIKLLQLSHLELLDMVQEEMEQNPGLEESDDSPDPAMAQEAPEPAPATEKTEEFDVQEKIGEEMDWANYMDEYSSASSGGGAQFESEDKGDAPRFESFIAGKESLADHLLWQVMLRFTAPDKREIGEVIVGNCDQDGYLKSTVEEIAQQCQHPADLVEEVLLEMQTFDPVGVCARDLAECLLIQARHMGLGNTLVTRIISKHMNFLENKNYKAICRALRVSHEDVISAVRIIMAMEPRPGREFSDVQPNYIVPDIYIYRTGDDFEVMLNDDGLPKLRVSRFYRAALQQKNGMPSETRDYVQDKLRSAAWLIRSIHQRQRTIFKVTESIVRFQKEFLFKGVDHLKPLILRDVAEDVEMHESTISRVTTNKYAHTPQGIFELKYFFNSSINKVSGGAVASESVKERIRQIIKGENQKKPYSDEAISVILAKENVKIARRTVAKYREMLGVLPSSKRKSIG